MPRPEAPDASLWSDIYIDGLAIAIISFSINASMMVLFASKHKYKTESNQVSSVEP